MTHIASRAVLIIDDDEDITSLLEAMLDARADYHLAGATSDPFDGAVRAESERPQVVIIGAHRNTFQVMELIARLRHHDRDLCIVLLADLADPITLLDALAAGATTVLSSEWGWSELMVTLDELLADGRHRVA